LFYGLPGQPASASACWIVIRQFFAQLLAQFVIKVGQRFVLEHQVGFFHQGYTLLLPSGKFLGFTLQGGRSAEGAP
jgi:hypothetical protein